jgi:hypothetical protein
MLARSLPLLLLIVLANGCLKTEFVTANSSDGAGADAGLADEGNVAVDDGVTLGSDASVDSADAITGSDADVDAKVDAGCGGTTGCPCTAASDCLGGFCVNYAGGPRCAALCTGSCPAGLTCTPADGGTSLCTDPWAHLCAPCQSPSSCQDLGNAAGTCADLTNSAGVQGWFCTRNCLEDKDCPADHACIERAILAGPAAKVCTPISGQCACNGLAIQSAAVTTCGSSGTCPGTRMCKASGMGPCEVPAAVTETCNGVDDDCNGETDETSTSCDDGNPCSLDGCSGGKCVHLPGAGTCVDTDPCTEDEACVGTGCVGTPTLCDDNNPCTADSCDPIEGCVGKATAGGCNDANACTTGEACQDGQCLGGQTVGCDDANACTDDACDPVSGCVHMPNVAGCSDASACTTGDLCGDGACKTTAIVCDDGTGCTLDSCDAQKGCVFTPGPDKDCGTASLP